MKALPKLYKRTSTGKIQEWEMFIDGNKYWAVTGQQEGKKITNNPTTCEGKNIGKANETTPEQQAESEGTAKWEKQVKLHYFQNIEDVDKIAFVKVMLARGYEDRKDKVVWKGALISPKLDGIRFVAKATGSHSRNGKPLGGGDVLREVFEPLFKKYPDLVLDGELYNHDYKDLFGSLVSLIRRDFDKIDVEKKDIILSKLQYHVYDMDITSADTYIIRYNRVKDILTNEFPELLQYIKLVPYQPVSSESEMMEWYEKYMEMGYEGGILRFDKKYENKRTWNLLKIKEFIDEEFEIVEVLQGDGNKSHTAGSLTMKFPNGTTFNSNIKGGFEVYDWVWANRESLVGKSATIQFFRYSEYGIPRFPYAIKFAREDYE